jgi:hypothetical protein
MAIELKIVWDGSVPGLREKRVSVASFGEPIKLLLAAYKRIASNMITNAASYKEAGRLKLLAQSLDLEIVELEKSSSGLHFIATMNLPPGEMIPLFLADIEERASKELLDSVRDESRGLPRNASVRNYLRKLPTGLTKQRYVVSNGNGPYEVVIDSLNLVDLPSLTLPYLRPFTGVIVGVGFAPGTSEVRVRIEEENLRLMAKAPQVEKAIELRGRDVQGLAVIPGVGPRQARLLRLTSIDDPPFRLTPELENKYVFERWDGLLKRLAE